MPVTLKTGVMKYRKSDGTYSVMDALIPEQTQDQIAAIETAGQEQVDAVEQKGQDILSSLPEDYTELETDVGGLKSAIEELEAGSLPALGASSGQVPTADGEGSWDWQNQPVTDVQVNGMSILSNGVANVPVATSQTPGVVIQGPGLVMQQNKIWVNKASDNYIRVGMEEYDPIVPQKQHASAFYGLAKAAGADMASSSNPVGTYTDAAKVAIQKMLGIYEAPWELIREDTFTKSEPAIHEISVDGNGQAFELTDAILMFETPVQSTEAAFSNSGNLVFSDGSRNIMSAYIGAWNQPANGVANGGWLVAEQRNGLVFSYCKKASTSTNGNTLAQSYNAGFGNSAAQSIIESTDFVVRLVKIAYVRGTGHYKLYGKRKWN